MDWTPKGEEIHFKGKHLCHFHYMYLLVHSPWRSTSVELGTKLPLRVDPPFQLGFVVQGSKQIIRKSREANKSEIFRSYKNGWKNEMLAHPFIIEKSTLSLRCQITSRSPHWTFKRQCYCCIEVSGWRYIISGDTTLPFLIVAEFSVGTINYQTNLLSWSKLFLSRVDLILERLEDNPLKLAVWHEKFWNL